MVKFNDDPGKLIAIPNPNALYPIYVSTKVTKVYVGGSMRNPAVQSTANVLRQAGFDVFDDWHSPGPESDDFWMEYERKRGRSYKDAMDGAHVWNVFDFDKKHLDATDAFVLVLPTGKSAHMELGYVKGKGKRAYVLFDKEPERWDIMYRFADALCFNLDELVEELKK